MYIYIFFIFKKCFKNVKLCLHVTSASASKFNIESIVTNANAENGSQTHRVSSSSFFLLFQDFLLFSSFLGKMSSLSSFLGLYPLNVLFGGKFQIPSYKFFKKNFQPRFARPKYNQFFKIFFQSHSADHFTSSSCTHTSPFLWTCTITYLISKD